MNMSRYVEIAECDVRKWKYCTLYFSHRQSNGAMNPLSSASVKCELYTSLKRQTAAAQQHSYEFKHTVKCIPELVPQLFWKILKLITLFGLEIFSLIKTLIA